MKPTRYVWIRLISSRGTDVQTCLPIWKDDNRTSKEIAEEWADRYVSNSSIDSFIVKYEELKTMLKRSELLKQWDKICVKYEKIKAERERIMSFLNVDVKIEDRKLAIENEKKRKYEVIRG